MEKKRDRVSATDTAKLMTVLSRHLGREKAIGADALYAEVYGEEAADKISGCRRLRYLVTALRHDGTPIASVPARDGGGYYLPVGSELQEYIKGLQTAGIRKLAIAAKLTKLSLPAYLGQIEINLRGDAAGHD